MIQDQKSIRVIAFGWFGTLMDEVPGMQQSLTGFVENRGRTDLFAMAEAWQYELERLYQDEHFVPWHELAANALRRVAQGFDLPDREVDPTQIQRWAEIWPLYEDHSALGRIGRRYEVAALTQMDRTTVASCAPRLARTMDFMVTSDFSRTYKPSKRYFDLLLSHLRLDEPEQLLIISACPELDLEVPETLGFQTVYVDREGGSDGPKDLYEAVALLA
jgi:FMN phosphatase YigB (HAD superfamily)